MANGADGSIVIDTKLDETGFQKGSQRMESAVNGLNNSVNQVGKNMASAVQSVNPALQSMGQAAQYAGARFQNYLGSGEFAKSMTDAQKSANSLAGQLARLGDSSRMGVNTNAQMTRFQINVEKAESSLSQLKDRMEQFENQRINTAQYDALQKEWERLDAVLANLYYRQNMMEQLGVKKNSSQWKRLTILIEETGRQIDAVEQKQRALQAAGQSYTMGGNTAEYQHVSAQLQRMSTELARYQQMAENFDTVSGPAKKSESSLKSVDKELQQKPKDASLASKAIQAFGNTLSNLANLALRTTAVVAKMGFHGLSSGAKGAVGGIKKLVSMLSGFNKKGRSSTLTSKGLVRSLLSLKTMLISRIREKLITTLMRGFGRATTALAKYSSEFNAAMSSMQNSMTGLSGNMAVFAGNIVNAVAPALSTIIDWISTAISYLNAFFALLSGKRTYTVAKKGASDYAKSLKSAGGAAKELNEQVYGFDDLNKANSTDSGGGGSGMGATPEFEEAEVEDLPANILAFMQSIKDAFAAGNFEDVGAIVAGGMNTIVLSVDSWINSTLRPAAATWSVNIARILNGFIGGIDWTMLGTLFSSGFNTIVNALFNFAAVFDWMQLASSISAGINGAINGVNWNMLGSTLGLYTQGIWTVFFGTLAGIEWTTLGTNIANGLNMAFSSVDWVTLTTLLTTSFNGIIAGLDASILEFNWIGTGSTLANCVNTIFSSSDWSLAGKTLSDAFISLLGLINTSLMETDWQQIGNSVAEYVAGIDWSGVVTGISTGIGAALGGLAAFLWGLIEGAWDDTKEYFAGYFDLYGGDVIKGLLAGILNAFVNIGKWIMDNIVTPFVDGFKAAFGISSPSTVMEELGGFLIEGLLQGIQTAWTTLIEWFTTALSDFKTTLSDAWESVKTTASEKWESIKTTVSDTWTNITQKTKETWTNTILPYLSTTWESVKTTASTAWEGIKTTIVDWFTGTHDDVKGIDWTDVGSATTAGVKQGILNGWSTFSSWVKQKFSGLVSSVKRTLGINSPSKVFAGIGVDTMKGLVVGLKDEEGTVDRTMANISASISEGMQPEAKATLDVDAMVNGLDVAIGKLSKLAAMFNAIASTITSMGGLNLPSVASGSFTPYKVRVSDTNVPQGESERFLTFARDFDETMSDQQDVLREILEVIRRLRLTVDADSLEKAITSRRRDREMTFGGAY